MFDRNRNALEWKMSLVCPISDKYMDENIARLNALFTLGLILVFLLTPFKWVILLVVIDLLLRRSMGGRFSYITRISKLTSGILMLKRININAGPKLFAANVGLLLSVAITLFYISGLTGVSYVLAGTLAFFTVLESIFNICVACVLYPLVFKYLA